MEENNKTQNQAIVILALIALIVALVIGVKLVFAGLDAAIDSEDMIPASSQSVQMDASSQGSQSDEQDQAANGENGGPNFCPHCGEEMREGFQWSQFCPYCGEKVE